MAKYHIKKNGEKAICRATVRACPRGGASQHFESVEDCDKALDIMNEKAAKNEFAIARVGNKIVISEESKKSIRDLTTAQLNIEKIENTSKLIRNTIKDVFEELGVKKVNTEYGGLSVIAASQRTVVDVDKMMEADIYSDYLKDSDRKSYVMFKIIGDEDGSKRKTLIKPDNFEVPFSKDDVVILDNGEARLSERGLALIKNLRDIDLSLKEVKANHDEMRDKLNETMKEESLPGIKFGGSTWESVPETTAKIVDTQKMKDEGVYDEYTKKIDTVSSLRARWAK